MRIRTDRNHVLIQNNFKKLIIIGKKDPVLDYNSLLEEAKKTASETVIFPNGHMSHIENRAELVLTLRAFIKKCSLK